MNPSLSHDLQFLNYLEVFGHRHGAAALRKAMHLPSELPPAGEAQGANPMAPDRPGYVRENWAWPEPSSAPGHGAPMLSDAEWPDIIGSAGPAPSSFDGLAALTRQLKTDWQSIEANDVVITRYETGLETTKHRFIHLDGSERGEACCK